MRRIAVLLSIILFAAACTTAEPEAPATTTASPATTLSSPTEIVTDTIFRPCPEDLTETLDRYLEDLGLGHLAGDWRPGAGPLSGWLATPDPWFTELDPEYAMPCTAEYLASAPTGEFVEVVAAWDEDRVYALIGGFAARPGIEAGESAIAVDLDHASTTRLHRVSDDLHWAEVPSWSIVTSLEPFVAIVGDDPVAVLAAWNRSQGDGARRDILRLSRAGSWGVGPDIPDYTLYPDGNLLTPGSVVGYPPTFGHGVVSYELTDAQVGEINAMALATGITAGETFEPPEQNVMDASTLGIWFRHEDVTYIAGLYNPAAEEATPARQALVDLESHLATLVESLEPTHWVPDSFVVRVARHGPYAESNTMYWPVSFDLMEASARLCTLLDGDEAESYLTGLDRVGGEYQNRFRTIFEQGGNTYSVHAIPILPGSSMASVDDLAECRGGQVRSVDPMIAAAFWDLRGISEYEITLRLLSCPFDTCDEQVVTLDGSRAATIPSWGVYPQLSDIDDLFELANHEDLELEEFVVDGIVGIPIRLIVSDTVSSAVLTIETTYFETATGSLEIEHDRQIGISLIPTGFEDWMP